jgi:N-acetyl-anhydromuramyl-L-alanine amidase AmpD
VRRPTDLVTPAIRRTPSPHCWTGRPFGPPVAFVLHTQTGGESGTVAEFLNSAAQFSTHYCARLDGSLDCYVDPHDRAWCNGILEPGHRWAVVAESCAIDAALNPNHVTITCETEDDGDPDQPVTDQQFNAVLYAAWEAKLRYPRSLRFLAQHADISPQSRTQCPGNRWIASGRFVRLAEALGLQTLID